MSYSFSFELNELPPSLNKYLRMHYHERNTVFKNLKHKTWIEVRECPPLRPLTSYKIVCTRYTTRPLDPFDNLPASFKVIIDALTAFKIIKDDKWGMADMITCRQVRVKTRKEHRVTIKIEEL